MESVIIFALFLLLICISVLVVKTFKRIKRSARSFELALALIYSWSLLLFLFGMLFHSNPYYKPVDPVDHECYSPFSQEHSITLIYLLVLFHVGVYLLWKKGKLLPPIIFVTSILLTLIGTIVNIGILLQVSKHESEIFLGHDDAADILFMFAPGVAIAIGILLLVRTTRIKISETQNKEYKNKLLYAINNYLLKLNNFPVAVLIFFLPIALLSVILLTLLGQDVDSCIKVFQDTTLWRFSQQMHPPPLDHKGHYLCTIAAKGNPALVKPISIGRRGGKPIIVNRQLQIANAFEELIQDFSPVLHKVIRTNYDRYGYNLSLLINSSFKSNILYLIMKPLEWFFLIILYTVCEKPEDKISKQYLPNEQP